MATLLQEATSGALGASPYTITFENPLTAGSLLIVAGCDFSEHLLTEITGGGVSAWRKAEGTILSVGGTGTADIWYAENSAGGPGVKTLTLTATGATNGVFWAGEYAEMATTMALIAHGGTTNVVQEVLETASVTPSMRGQLIIAVSTTQAEMATNTYTNGFTESTKMGTFKTANGKFADITFLIDTEEVAIKTSFKQGSVSESSTAIAVFGGYVAENPHVRRIPINRGPRSAGPRFFAGRQRPETKYIGRELTKELTAALSFIGPFPTTPVLDSLTGRTEAPLNNSSKWGGTTFAPTAGLSLEPAGAYAPTAGALYASVWLPKTFVLPIEVYATLETLPAGEEVTLFWVNSSSSATPSGYYVEASSGSFSILRSDSNGEEPVLLSVPYLGVFNNGDSFGMTISKVGLIRIWYKPVGGTWIILGSVIDTTYSFSGFLMTGFFRVSGPSVGRITNFGGGSGISELTKQTEIPALGGLSFTGSIPNRSITRTITGGLSFVGSVVKNTTRSITGALSFTGSIAKKTIRTLTGAALSFAGSITKKTLKNLTGVLSFTGSFATELIEATQTFLKTLEANLSFSGSTTKKTSRTLTAAALSFTGTSARMITIPLTGALSFAGSISKSISRRLTGALSFSGAMSKTSGRTLTGALSFSGSVSRSITRSLSGVLSFSGSFSKSVSRKLTATLSFAGSATRAAVKNLSGALSFTGSIPHRAITRAMTAQLSFSGAVARSSRRLLTGSQGFAGEVNKQTRRGFTGAVGFSGSIKRQISKALSAALNFTGIINTELTEVPAREYTGALSFGGSLSAVLIPPVPNLGYDKLIIIIT